MSRATRYLLFFAILLACLGCQGKLYEYTDSKFHVSVSYPGNLTLISDQESMKKISEGASGDGESVDHPELLFVLSTAGQSRMSASVHHLPEGMKLSADEYYQASTAKEIAALGATVIDPKSDITINGKVFQMVGFRLKVDEMTTLHVRIYQHLDPKTGQILVVTPMVDDTRWDEEWPSIEPVIDSLKLGW